MAFPASTDDLTVELDLVGDWSDPEDISAYVFTRDALTLTRGKTAEGSTVDPSSLTLTLKNLDGRFSPRNPTGPYYGQIGRNTGLRLSVLAGSVRAYPNTPTAGAGSFSTPDSVATSITGDLDLRIDLTPVHGWRFQPGSAQTLLTKDAGGSQRSYNWELSNDGKLRLFWWPTGASPSVSATSTVPVPYPVTGRRAVRATLDVNNGASGWTVTFYTADTISGSWVQLGDAVTGSGTTSIFNGTASTAVWLRGGPMYAAEVRSGIGGTVVASPDFTAQAEGSTSFADAQGNTWTSTTAACTARRYRFYGEVADWPQAWDPSGSDVYSQITAAGVLRRLQSAGAGLRSTLYRGITRNTDDLLAYWPMEDAGGAASLASAVAGNRPARLSGTPDLASFSDFAASEPIPVARGSAFVATIGPYSATTSYQVRFLMAVPDTGDTDGAIVARVWTTGTARRWDLVYQTGGNLGLRGFEADGTQVSTSGFVAYAVDGKRVQVSLEFTQNGADVDWRFSTLNDDRSSVGYSASTLTGHTIGRITQVSLNAATPFTDTAFGHLYVQGTVTDLTDLADQLAAWAGESAGARIVRLCGEEGVTVGVVGDTADSEAMGPQASSATLAALLAESAEADQGLLTELRNGLGIGYRTRVSLINQAPALALDYSAADLTGLEPVDDDQEIHNDVSVSRSDGSSFRAVQTDGPLSTASPPDGVGRYDQSLTVNVDNDGQLRHAAGWRLHLGTADEPRYPAITVNLARAHFTADADQTAAALDLDVGDRITVANLPAWLPPDGTSQLARGLQETLGAYVHTVTAVGTAGRPWQVGIYDDPADLSRCHPDGSTLDEDLTTTETAVDVATASGPLWTTDAAEMPFDVVVGGERMTVTAISGATSPQTFTVTRSVNGVVKGHSSGAAVDLADPTYYSI